MISNNGNQPDWKKLERLIVITDEQSHDGILPAWTAKAYVVNVAPYKRWLSYDNGWTHIDGWSERVVDYIAAAEAETAERQAPMDVARKSAER